MTAKKGALPPKKKPTAKELSAAIELLDFSDKVKLNAIKRDVSELKKSEQELLTKKIENMIEANAPQEPQKEDSTELEFTNENIDVNEDTGEVYEKFKFVQFKERGDSFTGFFLGTMNTSEDDQREPNLEGLRFKKYGDDDYYTYLVGSYHNLVKFFSKKQPSEKEVYRITLREIETLKGGRVVYEFQVQVANL